MNFPTSPALNDTYSLGSKTWKWNGVAWDLISVGLSSSNVVTALGFTPLNKAGDTMTGNLAFSGTGLRITGDFSGATHANRLLFQSNAANTVTSVGVIPNGTSTISRFFLYNNSDPTNASYLHMGMVTDEARIWVGANGSGTNYPLVFQVGGSEATRITTARNFLIGSTTDNATDKLQVTGSMSLSSALRVGATPSAGTAGQVLTSAGVGAAPTWTTVSGGSSQWTTSGSDIYYNTGNVGVGVIPNGNFLLQAGSFTSAATRSFKLMSLYGGISGGGYPQFGYNFRSTATTSSYLYDLSDTASAIEFQDGFLFKIAASGTAGNAITFTQALALEKDKSLAFQGATPQTGTGITFPATQSASSDANTLDDYEEGTWTPTAGGSLTVVGTFSSTGKYTKVGRLVTVSGTISATTSLTLTANQQVIGGLPFNNTADSAGGTITSGTNTGLLWMLTGGTTQIYSSSSNGPSSTFYFSLTYYAS